MKEPHTNCEFAKNHFDSEIKITMFKSFLLKKKKKKKKKKKNKPKFFKKKTRLRRFFSRN